jgi:hypothetical protein
MKKSWLLAESRVGLFAIIVASIILSQIMMASKLWAGCISSPIGCVPDGRPGDCDAIFLHCVPTKPPGSIPPCQCVPVTSCSSGDAVLVNVQFPVPGEATYNISSPARTLQSISVISSSNITSFTLPSISSDGHSATGGVFIKANPNASATVELEAAFVTPAFACTIDPTTTTLRIDQGHTDVQSFNMIPKAEHFIEIDDGSPGLNSLRIDVNGKYFRSLSLTSGGAMGIDASAAMNRGENTLTFTGEGKTGSSANITISDTAPASPSGNKNPASAQKTGKRLMFRF